MSLSNPGCHAQIRNACSEPAPLSKAPQIMENVVSWHLIRGVPDLQWPLSLLTCDGLREV